MTRWLAVDHGHKRIGLALGDTDQRMAGPLRAIPAGDAQDAIELIRQAADDHDAAGIVVGWPLNMDGSEGPQGAEARQFAQHLAEATGFDVRLWDERLSSFEADAALAGQWTRKKRRQRQDAVAAAAFLQDFLNADGPANAPRPADADLPPAPSDQGG